MLADGSRAEAGGHMIESRGLWSAGPCNVVPAMEAAPGRAYGERARRLRGELEAQAVPVGPTGACNLTR